MCKRKSYSTYTDKMCKKKDRRGARCQTENVKMCFAETKIREKRTNEYRFFFSLVFVNAEKNDNFKKKDHGQINDVL